MEASLKKSSQPRLMSLDALRGFDIFWILGGEALFAGMLTWTGWQGWKIVDAQMHHSQWHGFTFYDLIFPLFIFLSGVALGLSPKRLDKLPLASRLPVYRHAFKRLALLLFLGVLYNHGWGTGMPVALDEIRYASVLGRIGFAWFFAAILVWHTSLKTQLIVAMALLFGYACIQLVVPVPGSIAGDLSMTGSINALAGVFTGRFIVRHHPKGEWAKAGVLFIVGIMSLGLGWLCDGILPVNKDLWTSSFVLVTTGWSLIFLAIFYALVDVLKWHRLAFVFVVIGCNAIIIYLASSLVKWDHVSASLFGGVIYALPETMRGLAETVGVLTVQWLLLYWMYKRSIFIKV